MSREHQEPTQPVELLDFEIEALTSAAFAGLNENSNAAVVFGQRVQLATRVKIDEAFRQRLQTLTREEKIAVTLEMDPCPTGEDIRFDNLLKAIQRHLPGNLEVDSLSGSSTVVASAIEKMIELGQASKERPIVIFVPDFIPRKSEFEPVSTWLRALVNRKAVDKNWEAVRILITSSAEDLGAAQGGFNVGEKYYAESFKQGLKK